MIRSLIAITLLFSIAEAATANQCRTLFARGASRLSRTKASDELAKFLSQPPKMKAEFSRQAGETLRSPISDNELLESTMVLANKISGHTRFERGMDASMRTPNTPANVDEIMYMIVKRPTMMGEKNGQRQAFDAEARLLLETASRKFNYDPRTGAEVQAPAGWPGLTHDIQRIRVDFLARRYDQYEPFIEMVGPSLTVKVGELASQLRVKYGRDIISPLRQNGTSNLEVEFLPNAPVEAVSEALEELLH